MEPIGLLAFWFGVIVLTVALIGGRALVVRFPEIAHLARRAVTRFRRPAHQPPPIVYRSVFTLRRLQQRQRLRHYSYVRARATTTIDAAKPIAIQQNDTNEALLLARADALAALIVADKVKQTEGIKLVFGLSPSSTNKLYSDAVAAVKASVARRQMRYPPLVNNQPDFHRAALHR